MTRQQEGRGTRPLNLNGAEGDIEEQLSKLGGWETVEDVEAGFDCTRYFDVLPDGCGERALFQAKPWTGEAFCGPCMVLELRSAIAVSAARRVVFHDHSDTGFFPGTCGACCVTGRGLA